jgi:hypothetical protein
MPSSVETVGIYKLPASLGLTASCFGKSVPVKIGDVKGVATLPTIEWPKEVPRVIAPALDPKLKRYVGHYIYSSDDGRDGEYFWGSVSGWNPKKGRIIRAHLGAVLIKFDVPSDSVTYTEFLHGRGHPQSNQIESLFRDADGWFDRVRTWVEAAVDQDANPDTPLPQLHIPGNNLHILTVEDDLVSLPATAHHITITADSSESLGLTKFRKAVMHSNSGRLPSDAHVLLLDGRAAFRRKHHRRAVIDAGSAVEIALADFNRRVTGVNMGSKPTLGNYVNQPRIAAQAGLSANINLDLVTLRNDAIHQNKTPSREETLLALSLGKETIDHVDPLPL